MEQQMTAAGRMTIWQTWCSTNPNPNPDVVMTNYKVLWTLSVSNVSFLSPSGNKFGLMDSACLYLCCIPARLWTSSPHTSTSYHPLSSFVSSVQVRPFRLWQRRNSWWFWLMWLLLLITVIAGFLLNTHLSLACEGHSEVFNFWATNSCFSSNYFTLQLGKLDFNELIGGADDYTCTHVTDASDLCHITERRQMIFSVQFGTEDYAVLIRNQSKMWGKNHDNITAANDLT